MTDTTNAEEVLSPPTSPILTEEEKATKVATNFERWNNITGFTLEERLSRLDFIIDSWGTLEDYKDLVLPKGWTVATTSRNEDKEGTITVSSEDPNRLRRLRRSIKTFVANHGLRLSQADTFIETLYFAKYQVLPLISVVLNNKHLYKAYRAYRREFTSKQYIDWIHQHDLQYSDFNIKLQTTQRVQIAELISRMTRADVGLREVRALQRQKYQDKLDAAKKESNETTA